MNALFQTYQDDLGDAYMVAGWAFQLSTGQTHRLPSRGEPVGGFVNNGAPVVYTPVLSGVGLVAAGLPASTLERAGGSGRNLILEPYGSDAVAWYRIPRIFTPASVADVWVSGDWTIHKTSASTAELSDGANVIAEQSSGTAPYGIYVATSTGEDDYNSSATFSLAATAETGAIFPDATIAVSAGTFETTETFETADGVTWAFPVDTLAEVIVSPDGSADLVYDGDLIAERPAGGNPYNPAGLYTATTQGQTDFNGGSPWTATITADAVSAAVGWIYVVAHLASGVLTKLRGPYHSVFLPTTTADFVPVPIARSGGTGSLEQFHTGMIHIP